MKEIKHMVEFLLSWRKDQEQLYFLQPHSIVKESRSAFPKTTLHNEGKVACASFPCSTRTSALP